MEVTITTSEGVLTFDAEALDAAVFVGNVCGYFLDLEPTGDGAYRITAEHWRSSNRIVANGKTVRAAAKKFISLIVGETRTG